MDRLGSLTAFVHAAETRSFTSAGRQMGISSSAVGKAVARLEERVGTRLFHRSTRSITLTPEGELFLSRCQRIFSEIEAAELELAHSTQAPRGRLRVSLPMVGSLMMPAINRFAITFPDIELDLDFSDRLVDIIEEGFDVVMRTGTMVDSNLMTRTLGHYEHCIVGSPPYLARRGVPSTPEDLLSHACLQHRLPSSRKLEPWPIVRDGIDLELDIPVTAVASTLEPLISMALADIGLICVPVFTVRRYLEAGTLKVVLDGHLHSTGVFRILWPSSRHTAPKIKAFVDFMVANLFPAEPGTAKKP